MSSCAGAGAGAGAGPLSPIEPVALAVSEPLAEQPDKQDWPEEVDDDAALKLHTPDKQTPEAQGKPDGQVATLDKPAKELTPCQQELPQTDKPAKQLPPWLQQ